MVNINKLQPIPELPRHFLLNTQTSQCISSTYCKNVGNIAEYQYIIVICLQLDVDQLTIASMATAEVVEVPYSVAPDTYPTATFEV